MRTCLQGRWLDYRLVSMAPPVDPVDSAAREVRVSEYVQQVIRRWYVVVATVVVAVLLVVLRGVSPAHTTEGTATVYLGQPVTPGGGAVFSNPPFGSLSSAQTVANSDAVLKAAAAAAGVSVSSVRGNVAVHQAGGGATASKAAGGPVTVTVIVQGSWSHTRSARTIAGVVAAAVQRSANTYQAVKIAQYTQEVAGEQRQLSALRQNLAVENTQIARLAGSAGNGLALVALLNQRTADTTQIVSLTNQLSNDQTSLASVRTIEAAQIISAPAGRTVTATTRRSSLVIAAFIGLIVGCLIALAWEAMRRPRGVRAGD